MIRQRYVAIDIGGRKHIVQMPTQMPSIWQAMKSYINAFYKYKTELKTISRQQIIKHLEERGYTGEGGRKHWTVDTYRNWLYKAGYLSYMKRLNGKKWLGHYIIEHQIPSELTLTDLRNEAYNVRLGWDSTASMPGSASYRLEANTNWDWAKDYPAHNPMTGESAWEPEEFLSKEDMEI